MSRRYETTGQRRPHEIATGYQHASRYDVPLERDPEFTLAGQAKLFAAVVGLLIVATLLIAAF